MRREDAAISTVLGAIILLGILGVALVVVNAYYVPRQGAGLEAGLAERAESAMVRMAVGVDSVSTSTLVVDAPLRAERATPPLLSGVVLTPARTQGSLALATTGPNVTLSVLVDAPAGGVPPGDPIRADGGAGKMRVYLLGNATAGHPVGHLDLVTGGAYTDASRLRLAAGALVARGNGTSSIVTPPAMSVHRTTGPGATTQLDWTLPLLAGPDALVTGGSSGQVALTPGPSSQVGGGSLVHNVTLRIETSEVAAWRAALTSVAGSAGYVNHTLAGAADNGTVTLDVAPPAGTPATTRAVAISLVTVRYEVSLSERSG